MSESKSKSEPASTPVTDGDAAEEQHPFAGLLPPLRAAIEKRGFTSLTPVQVAVLEAATQGENLRISSQTGSGKTLALGMAIAEDLIEAAKADPKSRCGPRALLIAPTRELAQQVARELEWLYGEIRGLHVAVCTGGTDIGRERRVLRRNPVMLVGTPGRLLDHLTARALDVSEVRHVVLDEADQMLDMGFKDELDAIIDELPTERHSHLVSATFPREVRRFAERFAPDAQALEGTRLGQANQDIEHLVFLVRERDRYAALVNNLLMAHGGRCLVFVKRRAEAAELAEKLAGDGFGALPFSGDLSQGQRNRTLAAFRRGVVQILVATDVAARGIDVPDIALVVHGDIPYDAETYTHRSGRTGRAGQTGRSILLAVPRAERRVRRLMDQARVEASYPELPSAHKIRKSVAKRTRKRLHAAMEAPAADPSSRDYAAELLERYEPAVLVAELLRLAEGELPCDPHDVSVFGRRDRGDRGDRGDRSDRRGGEDRAHSDRNERRPRGNFDAFRINWGHKKGANPSRLLAHLCRRGGIDSRAIGAMQIEARESFFEIASDEAEGFFASAQEPDARDPELVIQRSQGPVRSQGPRDHRGKPRGGPRGRGPNRRDFGRGGGKEGGRPRKDGPSRWIEDGHGRPKRRGPTHRKK